MTFNSIAFTPQNNLARLDDVRVGAAVPKPGTGFLALGGVGLLALGRLRKYGSDISDPYATAIPRPC